MIRYSSITTLVMTCVCATTSAEVVGFTDRDAWENAVGAFQTIDFTGFEEGTIITDQYSDLGVQFTDGNDWVWNAGKGTFPNNGSGLDGNNIDQQITVEFDQPKAWIGVDHPGGLVFDLYLSGEAVGTYENMGGGIGRFTGVVSSVMFDEAVLHKNYTTTPSIDDMHWGVPAPGAAAALALAGLLGGSRRRRA